MANPFDQFDAPASNPFDKFDEPAKPSGMIRKIADKGLGFVSGAVGATKAIADAAGAGNAVSGALGSANEVVNDYLSPEAKADQQEQSAIMAGAKGQGAWEGVKAGARAFGVAPVQTAIQGLGSIVPVIAGGIAGLPGAVATGVAMGAGTAKGAIYDEIKKRGGTEEEATKAQAYEGKNTDQIALGGALGAADAMTGVSRIAGGMVRNALGKPVAQAVATGAERGVFGRMVTGVATEMPLEAAQGGQEQVAANLAAQRAGYQSGTWDNVASNATLEALASAGPGAAFGAFDQKATPETPPPSPVEQVPAVEQVPPLQIGNTPDPMISFADGTVARQSEVDQYINGLPSEQQPAARAKLMGMAPQPAKPSEAMGLTPTAAPSLTNAAIVAVDSGASQQADPVKAAQDEYRAQTAAQLQQDDELAYNAYMTAIEQASTAQDEAPGETIAAVTPIANVLAEYDHLSDDEFFAALGATPEEIQNAATDQPSSPQASVANLESIAQDVTGGTGESTQPVDAKAVNLERIRVANQPQPTTLGTQTNAVAGPGFSAKDVVKAPNVGTSATPAIQENVAIEPVSQPAQPVMGEWAGATQPTQGALSKSEQAKADIEHLFGLPEKRAKAIERIAKGTAYFSLPLKAQEFIAKNGLKETHQSVKTARGWDIVAKSQPTENTSAQAPKALEVQTKQPEAPAAAKQVTPQLPPAAPVKEYGAGFEPIGARAFSEGKPRLLPTELRGRKHSTIGSEWYAGWDAAKANSPAAEIAPKKDEGTWMAAGRSDFAAGKPRVLPSYFTKPGDKNSKDWYRGWDAANIAAPALEQMPTKSKAAPLKQRMAQERQARADYFTPGNIVTSYGGHDEVLSYTPPKEDGGGWSVKVHAVKKVNGEWVRIGKPQDARTHSTQPDAQALKAGPLEKVNPTEAGNVTYTEPRADGAPFPNAHARGAAVEQVPVKAPEVAAKKPEIVVDKAEMRPYRKPDGSVGYEAVPIVENKQVTGDFGPIYDGYTNQPEKAIKKLMSEKQGEVADAFVHPELGKIAFIYGDESKGLRHIELKRDREFVDGIPEMLRKGRLERDKGGLPRAYIVDEHDPAHIAVIRLDWDGKDKVWLVTAYPDTVGKFNEKPVVAGSIPRGDTLESTGNPESTGTNSVVNSDQEVKSSLSEREKAAKAKMFNALGKLAALAGKNARMNWTQEEEQQILPIVIELFDGAMDLGAVTFQKAVRYVREFIAGGIDQETADAIPFETLQGAYIATSGRHKDKPVTTKRNVAAFDSLEELENSAEEVDTDAKPAPVDNEPKETLLGANDDTRRNATNDSEPLDKALPGANAEDGPAGDAETGAGVRQPDTQGNGRPQGGGSGRGNRVGGGKKSVLPGSAPEIRPLADGPVGKTEDRPQQLTGENPGNFVITDEFRLGQGTDGDKISGNLEAIRTLRLVQSENRYPTKDEQTIMARYVGWGGLKTVFDPKKENATDQYGKAQRELKTLLSPDEYRAANGSIRNAHYTAEGIVDGMWRVIRFMGFKGGRSLEPTVGIGNFIGRMPADMAASTEWHASELDTTTGQLAAMLYPEANILASTGFQDAPFADGAFDISVGNPPFGSQTITDKSPNRKHLNGQKIHNYIIAKSGMHLRPGGVMSMVVTHRFLDTANPEARDVLAKDFRFLGAFRLPNDAFKKNAGTDVVTDVVFLQKLGADEKRERDASWLDVNGSIDMDGQTIRVNRYYQDNPSHILGRSALDGSMQRTGEAEYTVHSDGRDIGKAIDALMQAGFSHMAGVLDQNNNTKALAPAMLTQSNLPIGGVMVNDEGKIIRRELNDDMGNAVVQEITADTLWKDQAAEWNALKNAVQDVKNAALAGKVTQDDANEVLALSRFLFKADGAQQGKPTKAVEAVYKLVEDLARPASFQWSHNEALLLITGALNRKQLGEDGYQSLKGMLDLRNRTLRLVMAEQGNDSQMEAYRADLNRAYDAFVKANGFLSDPKNANLLEGDIGAEAGIEANFIPAVSAAVAKSSGTPSRPASAKKSDIMNQRVNFPYKEISHADSPADALFASISEHGKVDIPYMAKITNQSPQAVIEALTKGDNPQLFRDPETGEYQEAERYLSGNVKHKLQLALERGMEANIKALEKSLPADKKQDQVKPNIRGMWMPPEIFTEFLQAIGYTDAKISVITSQGILQANGDALAMTDFGIQFRHGKRTPMDMFNSQASGKPIIISVTSNGKTYKDEQGTKEVNALAERMGKVFQEWAYADDGRVKRIVAAFNQNMNTHTPRTFDGMKYLKPVGASPSVVLRRTQMDGAWRMMQEKTMLADHVVGAGKTYTLITGIMERRRMGLSRKPMVVVPNHLVTQWARDFYKLYPGAKVLAASPADFAKKNRRRLLARIATGDYDAVIVGHTSIGFMETPTDDLKAIVDEKLAGLKEALAEARKSNESKRTLGQIEDRIDRYEARLKDLAARTTDDIGIDFKALGIDHLSVDEAHEFKNLEYSTSGDRVVGMNDPNGSKKAFDLYSKVRGLLSRGGSVTFATGTPVSNSLVEIYTMMSYLAHDELVLRGQEHFDSWSGAYAATETRLEYTATQKLKPRRVLAGLNNLSALRQLYEQFADIITMSDLKRIYTEEMEQKNKRDGTNLRTDFPVPRVKGEKRQLIALDITPAQKEYMDYLVARMAQIERKKSDREYLKIDNALNVLTDARKMSLDIRIVDPTAPRDENGKVATAAKNIKATYDLWNADRGTQLVFCDLSTPAKTAAKDARSIISATIEKLFGKDLAKQAKKQLDGMTFEKQWSYLEEKAEQIAEDPATSEEKRDAIAEYMSKVEDPQATMNVADIGFSVYDDLKTVLMESGIPESEIAFIHDYNTPEQKDKLFDRVNNGYVRVLIGSSMKMGAGMNVQERLVALHHMDAPWRPSDVEQREGRIIRQKNALYLRDPDGFEVDLKAYSTNQTSDTVMWQILQRKAGAIEQFREGGLDTVQEEGGDSNQYAEFMATSTGNPVFRQKLEAERKLTDIESEIGGALIVRSNAQSFMESYARRRANAVNRLEAWQSFDASSASYGGESGTQAEFEAAMKVANDDYLVKYAAWTQKNADADLAIAKWEVLPEDTRGDKPSKPTMPSQPDLFTKSVQKASGYARAIGMALTEAKIDKSTKITMATGSILVTGSEYKGGAYWNVYAQNKGEQIEVDSSGAQTANTSTRIIHSLTPFGIGNKLKGAAKSYENDIAQLDKGKIDADKNSQIAVDTSGRDAAQADLRWYTAQVAFAEVEADIARGASQNRYIARDTRRNIGQTAAVVMEEKKTHVIDGVSYTTTGIRATPNWQLVDQATRDRDSVPAYVVVGGLEKGTISVVVQPKHLQKPKKETATKAPPPLKAERMPPVDGMVFATSSSPVAPGQSVSVLQVQQIAQKVLDSLGLGSVVQFQVERNPAAAGIPVSQGVVPTGGTSNGKVYAFADNIADESEAFKVVFHELFHLGLSQTVKQGQYIQMMLKLLQDPMVRKYAKEWKDSSDGQSRIGTMPANNWQAMAVEEALAKMGELLNTDQKGNGSIPLKMWARRMITFLADKAQEWGIPKVPQMLRSMTYTAAERFIQETILKGKSGAPVFLKDTRFASVGDAVASAANNVRDVNLPAGYKVADLINGAPGKLGWWHKTVGTQYHLAQKSPAFKRVFDGVQTFLNDVSYFATEAADLAPSILPKLETWKDIGKSPVSAMDTKAFSAPVFDGTLNWGRDESGKAVKMAVLENSAKALTVEQKAQRLLRNNHISQQVLKMWQGLPIDQFEAIIEGKFERDMLKAGAVFADAELKQHFNLTPNQIKLYREFRKTTDKSLTNLAIADMLRFGGKDVAPIRDAVLAAKDVTEAADTLSKYLLSLTDVEPDRSEVLTDTANKMIDKGNKAKDLMDRGYAPLSRFGQYTLDVVHNGERVYFGMFESKWEAARMNRNMQTEYPGAQIKQGTVSEEAYKLFAGVSPETLELFGDMLGLEAQGDGKTNEAFQEYLKLAKSNRSAMKRLIQRKGIAGFNEDAGRVLAGFVYSNARQTSSSLHMGEMTNAVNDMPKQQGELKDAAVKLVDYIKNPQEEAQALRGLLFTQYIGGSIASAMVNMTQPLTMTFPWLSQFGGVANAGKQMSAAMQDALKKRTGDATLDAAIKRAEEDGTVSPQEVHQLMQQAQGRGALRSGDGTTAGDLAAKGSNALSRFSLGWGKLFSAAEQFNRRVTFIAAYRTAVAQKMADPDAFARRAISETQGIYNCVDESTECLTTDGWKRHSELTEGDAIYAVDKVTGALVESTLLDVHRHVNHAGIAATEFRNANGFSMVLTDEHTCLVQNYSSRDKKYQRIMSVKAKDVKIGHHFVRTPQGDATGRVEMYSDDEVRLLAWVASEGHQFAHRGAAKKRGIGLVQSNAHNPQYVIEIDDLLSRMGGHFNRKTTGIKRADQMVCWQLRKEHWAKINVALPGKMLTHKLVSELTIPQMRIFLETFAKGDGHFPDEGGASITQKDAGNLSVLQAMAVLSGQSSTLYNRMGQHEFGVLYLAKTSKRAYRKEMEANPITLDMVWCPQTEHGTWIARRNGRTFVTGNSGNKPQWARGAMGGLLFTFKQYSVAYIEMLQRMSKNGPEGKKAALLALGVLFLLSGTSGLPGSDDLDDIISGAMQSMGYNFDSKQKRKEFFVSLFGEDGARFMERGVSGLPGVPIDVAGRMGLGNLIPGTGLFQKKPDHTRDVAELFGPGGDLVKRGYDAAGKALKGELLGYKGAIATAAPKAMQNLYQAYDMANMGMYRDQNGKKVLDTDAGDTLVKAMGFQPNDVARVQDASFDVQRMIGVNKMRESEIAGKWAAGLFEKDTDKVQEARLELSAWNSDNPTSPIRINFKQIMQRVNNMKLDKSQRLAKTAPKEIRAAVKQELSIQ